MDVSKNILQLKQGMLEGEVLIRVLVLQYVLLEETAFGGAQFVLKCDLGTYIITCSCVLYYHHKLHFGEQYV